MRAIARFIDPLPPGEKAAGRSVERVPIATATSGLVLRPANWRSLQRALQERADSTMGDDCYVSFCGSYGDCAAHSRHDPALSIDGSLPPTHTRLRVRKELVCYGFELRLR